MTRHDGEISNIRDNAAVSIRSQAVENVDARHGYTLEFSNQPNCHAIEYDEEEARLTAEAESSAACNCGGNHSGIVGFDGPGNGHAVTCPVRTAATTAPLVRYRLTMIFEAEDDGEAEIAEEKANDKLASFNYPVIDSRLEKLL